MTRRDLDAEGQEEGALTPWNKLSHTLREGNGIARARGEGLALGAGTLGGSGDGRALTPLSPERGCEPEVRVPAERRLGLSVPQAALQDVGIQAGKSNAGLSRAEAAAQWGTGTPRGWMTIPAGPP